MKTKFYLLLKVIVVAPLFFVVNSSHAQDTNTDNHTVTIQIPSVALLDLESSASKNFTVGLLAPTEAGENLVGASNSDLWLNYTSVLGSAITARKVTAEISSGHDLLSGLKVAVATGAPAGGAGDLGTNQNSPLELSQNPVDVITAIGSAYTGTGASLGHQLTYNVDATAVNFGALKQGDVIITITYTLVDEP